MVLPHGNMHREFSILSVNPYYIRTRICDLDFNSCDIVKISSKEYAAQAAANITDVGLGLH